MSFILSQCFLYRKYPQDTQGRKANDISHRGKSFNATQLIELKTMLVSISASLNRRVHTGVKKDSATNRARAFNCELLASDTAIPTSQARVDHTKSFISEISLSTSSILFNNVSIRSHQATKRQWGKKEGNRTDNWSTKSTSLCFNIDSV